MTDEETLLCVVFIVIIFCIVINFISVNIFLTVINRFLISQFPPQSALKYLRKLKIEQDQTNRGI